MLIPGGFTGGDEAKALCSSPGFQFSCRHGLVQRAFPKGPAREWAELICQSCGHPTQAHDAPAQEHHQTLEVLSDPEAHHEAHGAPAWTAPYVWETNYL